MASSMPVSTSRMRAVIAASYVALPPRAGRGHHAYSAAGMDLFVLFIELLFVVLFAATLVQYLQRRDPVSRDVMLTFSAVTALFIVSLVGKVFPGIPQPVLYAGIVLFFLQPVFTLHLVSLVRRVPRWVLVGSLVAVLGTVVPLLAIQPAPPTLGPLAIVAFGGVELIAAVYLLLAARRRRGPIRARL